MVFSITQADYITEYKIHFLFSDGVDRIIDFREFLSNAKNPKTKKYLNKQLFKSYY